MGKNSIAFDKMRVQRIGRFIFNNFHGCVFTYDSWIKFEKVREESTFNSIAYHFQLISRQNSIDANCLESWDQCIKHVDRTNQTNRTCTKRKCANALLLFRPLSAGSCVCVWLCVFTLSWPHTTFTVEKEKFVFFLSLSCLHDYC